LPVVQRFLYGEGRSRRGAEDPEDRSPMRVFRRRDVAAVRAGPGPGAAPIPLPTAHLDLYFFYDVDVMLLNVEVSADDLALEQAQELLYRFGRAYPPGWDAHGHALHCLHEVEWLGPDGTVLTAPDPGRARALLAP